MKVIPHKFVSSEINLHFQCSFTNATYKESMRFFWRICLKKKERRTLLVRWGHCFDFWVNQKFYNNQPITTKLRKKSGKTIVIPSPTVWKMFSYLNFNTSIQCFQNWTNQWIKKITDSRFTGQSPVGTSVGVTVRATCVFISFKMVSFWCQKHQNGVVLMSEASKQRCFDIVKN